jgi:hypothetical protein
MIEGIAVAKGLKAIGLKGFLAIGLGLALVIVMMRADQISKDREALRTSLAGERAGHAITRQSVALLRQSLEAFVGAGQAARIAQLAEIEAQAKDSAALQDQADAIRAELEALGEREPDERCMTPRSVINAEGL